MGLLIQYYKTGDLKTWDDYNIAWLQATEGNIDYINGFVEVYNDPLGARGSYESVVQIKDFDMSAKMEKIGHEAQWFEDNSPLDPKHKKKKVVGISYKTVIVAGEGGDSSPLINRCKSTKCRLDSCRTRFKISFFREYCRSL